MMEKIHIPACVSLEVERMPHRFSPGEAFILGLLSMATLQKVTINSQQYYIPGSCDSVSCIEKMMMFVP